MKKNILRILLLMLMVILFQNIIGIKEVKAVKKVIEKVTNIESKDIHVAVYDSKNINKYKQLKQIECFPGETFTFYVLWPENGWVMDAQGEDIHIIEFATVDGSLPDFVIGTRNENEDSGGSVTLQPITITAQYTGEVTLNFVHTNYTTYKEATKYPGVQYAATLKINVRAPEQKLNTNIHQKLQSRGYKLLDGFDKIYGMAAMARDWIERDGIVPKKRIESKKIGFNKTTYKYGKEVIVVYEATVKFDNIPFSEIKKAGGKTDSISVAYKKYFEGKDYFEWDKKTLKKGNKYSFTYYFKYVNATGGLYYSLTIGVNRGSTTKEEDERRDEQLKADIKDSVEEYEKAKKTMKAYLDKGQPRSTVEFTDVLEDTDYYTSVGNIDSDSAAKAEQKIGTVIKVITNIGIILSILMPAILGIKYMLGSVEEKADYKKDMIPYFVGAVLLFGVCTVVKILQSIGNSIN